MPYDLFHPLFYIQQAVQWEICDWDITAAPIYYFGFVEKAGTWKILKLDSTNLSVRVATGPAPYTTAWAGRAAQAYDYYDVEF